MVKLKRYGHELRNRLCHCFSFSKGETLLKEAFKIDMLVATDYEGSEWGFRSDFLWLLLLCLIKSHIFFLVGRDLFASVCGSGNFGYEILGF